MTVMMLYAETLLLTQVVLVDSIASCKLILQSLATCNPYLDPTIINFMPPTLQQVCITVDFQLVTCSFTVELCF